MRRSDDIGQEAISKFDTALDDSVGGLLGHKFREHVYCLLQRPCREDLVTLLLYKKGGSALLFIRVEGFCKRGNEHGLEPTSRVPTLFRSGVGGQ